MPLKRPRLDEDRFIRALRNLLRGDELEEPPPAAVRRARAIFRTEQARRGTFGERACFRNSSVRLAWGVLASILILVVSVSGVAAAQTSVPGEMLYPLKRTGEQVQVFVLRSPTDRAELHLVLAQKRLNEIRILLARQDPMQAPMLLMDTKTNSQPLYKNW